MLASTHNRRTPRPRSAWSRRAPLLMICLALVVLSGQNSQGQGPADTAGLTYFKNFFVTGNYITASVDFGSQSGGNGLVTGTISFGSNAMPVDADVVGAFLYWQTIVGQETLVGQPPPLPQGVYPTFRGFKLSFPDNPDGPSDIAKLVIEKDLASTFSPCWSGGGGTAVRMRTYRADVRRLLPYATDPITQLPVGKALVNNQSFQVQLPDNGTGNQTPQTAGATLVIIYRLPTETLKAVVLYDGLQLKPTGATPTTTYQTLRGFYDAPTNPVAKLSLLVGSGAKNPTEQVKFGGGYVDQNNTITDPTIATNPFFNKAGNPPPGSDRAWNAPTWDVGATLRHASPPQNSAYGEQVTVTLTHTDPNPYDCLTTSAIVFSTDVVDSDFDGLLDVWEPAFSGTVPPAPLLEPNGQPLPNLAAMGAKPDVQDIFVDLAFMDTAGYNDPTGTVSAHSHLPSQTVLDDIAAVFNNAAPRKNPTDLTAPFETKSGAVKIHFDVGNRYQSSPNVIKFQRRNAQGTLVACTPMSVPPNNLNSVETDCYSRGGERIDETKICARWRKLLVPGLLRRGWVEARLPGAERAVVRRQPASHVPVRLVGARDGPSERRQSGSS